jgi:hypothetical protein
VTGAVSSAGLAVAAAAVLGMFVGTAMATTGAITGRRRLGLAGARLCVGGPGLASFGMGLFLVGLPQPLALLALLPVSFGALLLWIGLRLVTRS